MPNETPNGTPGETAVGTPAGTAAGTAAGTQPHGDHETRLRLARGEESALRELYDTYASTVHGLALRFLGDEEAADRIVGEVFAEVWEHPLAYEPKRGSLRSWLSELTHRHSVRALCERMPCGESCEDLGERVRNASAAARADLMATAMPVPLRDALELAYVRRRDYRAAAAELGVSEDEARRRLRLGLQLLSTAMTRAVPGPGTGRAS
ncbi:sigma-70 family RNA polymerase sigma factor [Streptomyces glaucosporus]